MNIDTTMVAEDQSKKRRSRSYLRSLCNLRWRVAFVLLFTFIFIYAYVSTQSIKGQEKKDSGLIIHEDDSQAIGLRGSNDPTADQSEMTDKSKFHTDAKLGSITPATSTFVPLSPSTSDLDSSIHLPIIDLPITPPPNNNNNKKKPDVAQIPLVKKKAKRPQEEIKKEFDAGFKGSGIPPLDFGMDDNGGPDGVRAYGQHPHYMAKCHSCTHHKFMYVALEGNHEPEIVKNLARVMCAMQNLPPDCGQHFIETDCTPFTGLDNKDWFTFTFTMDPHNRAVSSWTLGLEHDIIKAGIPKHLLGTHLKQEERDCNFRRWVLWANGMDRAASMGCPFNKPDKQINAIYTKENRPALNFVGRIEHYKRDIISVLQLIDPSGKMVEYHEKHAKEFGLHPDHHPLDWKTWYRDGKKPNIWKLVTKLYREDIEKLGYSNEL